MKNGTFFLAWEIARVLWRRGNAKQNNDLKSLCRGIDAACPGWGGPPQGPAVRRARGAAPPRTVPRAEAKPTAAFPWAYDKAAWKK